MNEAERILDEIAKDYVTDHHSDVNIETAIQIYNAFKEGYKLKLIVEKRQNTSKALYQKIINIVCDYYNTSLDVISKKTRQRDIVQTRQIVMYFGKEYVDLSLKALGEIFNKDHAIVLYSHKTIQNLYETDKNIKYDIIQIRKEIQEFINIQKLQKHERRK